MLLEMLNEIVHELTEETKQISTAISQARIVVEKAQNNWQNAKDEEVPTIDEDDKVKQKYKVLMDYCNGLNQKPQALLDKMTRLSHEQIETSRKRENAHGPVQLRQQDVREAENRLGMLQEKDKKIQQQLREVVKHIQAVQRTVSVSS